MKTFGRHLVELAAAGAVLTVMFMASLVIAMGASAFDSAVHPPASVVASR